jgi:outer membrane protein
VACSVLRARAMHRLLVASCLVAWPAIASAAPPAMSLREAIRYAHEHQPSLAAARARVAVALAQSAVPRAGYAPRIAAAAEVLVGTSNNTTASYATVGILDVARVGGSAANAARSWSPDPSTLIGVSVHQELYDFGRLEAQADAYDALARAAGEDARGVQLDLDLLVEDSFYAVQSAKAILAAADAAVQRVQAHRDLAEAQVRAQLWSPIKLTRADADLANYTVDRVRAAGSLAIAQDVLAATIGAAAPAIDAGADDLTVATPPQLAAAMRDVDAQAPELRAARAQLLAQQRISSSIRSELRPDLSVSAELNGRAGGAPVTAATPAGGGWLPDVPNWDALVVLSWPIFDRVVSARARTSERIEAVRVAEIDQVAQQLRTGAERGYVELEVARSALPALQRALDAAQANHAQAEAQFTAGLGTAVELSDAEALLTDAQIELAVGQFQQSRARARLGRALAEAAP